MVSFGINLIIRYGIRQYGIDRIVSSCTLPYQIVWYVAVAYGIVWYRIVTDSEVSLNLNMNCMMFTASNLYHPANSLLLSLNLLQPVDFYFLDLRPVEGGCGAQNRLRDTPDLHGTNQNPSLTAQRASEPRNHSELQLQVECKSLCPSWFSRAEKKKRTLEFFKIPTTTCCWSVFFLNNFLFS